MTSQSRPAAIRLAGTARSRIGHQSAERQPGSPVDLSRKVECLGACLHTAAAHAGVAFDQHFQPVSGIGECRCKPGQRLGAVGSNGKCYPAVQGQQPLELCSPENIVGQKNIGEPGLGHHLRLADLLAGDAYGARLDLLPGEIGQLMRLDVGAKVQPVPVGIGLGAGDVGVGPVDVDEDGRRFDVVDGAEGLQINHQAASADRLSSAYSSSA
jgi:hypothetical protein